MSKKFTFDKEDGIKILTGLGIGILGAILTYLETFATSVDFGVWTPVVVSLNAALVNAGRKFLAGQ